MEKLKELKEGQFVEIFEKPITEENREGTAEIIKIEEVVKGVKNLIARLIVRFKNDDQWVYRTKYYKR
ncbi:hypothetical protein ES705_16862 [subsurface metagenome]